MSQVQLYTNPMSRGQIAHWMLEEIAQPYNTHWIEWGKNGNRSPTFLEINPMGKLPTIVHNGKVVTEAAAICLYLADVFPEANLMPTPSERADYYRWTLFAAGPLEHAVTNKAIGFVAPKEKEGMLGYGTFERTLETLSNHLKSNEFVCGKRFTAADVYVGSAVIWGLLFKSIPENSSLMSYRDRLTSRQAHRTITEINNAKK